MSRDTCKERVAALIMADIIGPILNDPLVQQFGSDALQSATNFIVEKGATGAGRTLARFFGWRFFGATDVEVQVGLERVQAFADALDRRLSSLEQQGRT